MRFLSRLAISRSSEGFFYDIGFRVFRAVIARQEAIQ